MSPGPSVRGMITVQLKCFLTMVGAKCVHTSKAFWQACQEMTTAPNKADVGPEGYLPCRQPCIIASDVSH